MRNNHFGMQRNLETSSQSQLDRVDRRILDLLQREGALPVAEVAARTGLSTTTCWRRIQHLEQTGVIRGREPVVSNVPRPGTQPPLRVENRRSPEVQWSTSWRNNSRYDWRNYRHHHRSRFHLGFYIDPYGWGYQPFSIGWRLWPSYYSRNYWINDPWMYRLPYAPPGYVWVRYWDDALLVDTWSGQVVDVIPDFFW